MRDLALKPKALQGISAADKGSCNLVANAPPGSGEPPGDGTLDFYIKYGDKAIYPADIDEIKNVAENWPDNNANKSFPGLPGTTFLDFAIQQSLLHNISPAFSIAIWWEEGGFGGLLPPDYNTRANSEFGCFPGGDTSQHLTFLYSFNCFVQFTENEHPYDPNRPQESFNNWMTYFCGPLAVPICSNNPGFVDRLESVYNTVAPGELISVSN